MDDNEVKKPIQRSMSEDTCLSEAGRVSGNSSGDESWSDRSSSGPDTPVDQGKTKLSTNASLFVPLQAEEKSTDEVPEWRKKTDEAPDWRKKRQTGNQRTNLSSGASVFQPGHGFGSQDGYPQMMSQPQVNPLLSPQVNPYMMAQSQANPYMAPCYPAQQYYMAPDGTMWGMCPVAMPVIQGQPPPLMPGDVPSAPVVQKTTEKPLSGKAAEWSSRMQAKKNEARPEKPKGPSAIDGGAQSPSGNKRWADESDDDEASPWGV